GTGSWPPASPGTACRGWNDDGNALVCQAGASIAACRFIPYATWLSQNPSCHWSCWSPPGVPNASTGSPPRTASVGDSVLRGRRPGASEFGRPSSSQHIWARVPRQKPRPGTAGELCSQPPDGGAEMMLPHPSTPSTWHVSPPVTPDRATVGSPARSAPAGPLAAPSGHGSVPPPRAVTNRGSRGRRPPGEPGRSSCDACRPTSTERRAAYRGSSSSAAGTSELSPYHASRSAHASLATSTTPCTRSAP